MVLVALSTGLPAAVWMMLLALALTIFTTDLADLLAPLVPARPGTSLSKLRFAGVLCLLAAFWMMLLGVAVST